MQESIVKLYKRLNTPFIRYGIMAVIVVGIEIASFWLLNSPLKIQYLMATVLSQLIGIVLNWVGSRYFVFGPSHHTRKKEFTLVALFSMVGVGWQALIVYITVGVLNQIPLLGKIVAIILTFVWNYFTRKKFIFHKTLEALAD